MSQAPDQFVMQGQRFQAALLGLFDGQIFSQPGLPLWDLAAGQKLLVGVGRLSDLHPISYRVFDALSLALSFARWPVGHEPFDV